MSFNWVELIGYGGSLLVALSLTMSNIRSLRWLNLAGALIFVVYGSLIVSYPIVVVNGFITVVDIYYLWRLYGQPDNISLLFGDNLPERLREAFWAIYRQDMLKNAPSLSPEVLQGADYMLAQQALKPVALVAFRREGNESARVLLDYLTPDIRDRGTRIMLHGQYEQVFRQMGIKRLVEEPRDSKRQRALQRLGFTQPPSPQTDWFKILS